MCRPSGTSGTTPYDPTITPGATPQWMLDQIPEKVPTTECVLRCAISTAGGIVSIGTFMAAEHVAADTAESRGKAGLAKGITKWGGRFTLLKTGLQSYESTTCLMKCAN